jgi:hypothetical protein
MPSGTRKQSGISHSDLSSEASDQNINKGSSTPVGGAGSVGNFSPLGFPFRELPLWERHRTAMQQRMAGLSYSSKGRKFTKQYELLSI